MSDTPLLGRLEQVDLRTVWLSESGDFTPWLAEEPNISLLADTLGMDLEVEAQEKSVGPYRADIICKDTTDGSLVLIENQLEKTDHTHLGQLMTYAAGLDAVTIVWIAERFTDEHRAALDWLNEITGEKVSFFGLEIELWKIGTSPIAPKFNVVCRPNNWVRRVAGTGRTSDNQNRIDQFWAELINANDNATMPLRFQKPNYNWVNLSIGKSDVHVTVLCRPTKNDVLVQLYMMQPNKELFDQLFTKKGDIEQQIGTEVIWERGPDQIASWLAISKTTIYDDAASRAEAVQWAMERSRHFEKLFRQIVSTR